MEYETLTIEEKKAIIRNRLRQYEQEHYNNSLNLEAMKSNPAHTKEDLKPTQDTIARLEAVIELHNAKIQALDSTVELVPAANGARRRKK